MIKRAPGSPISVPAIVHLRSDHYSLLAAERDGQYLLQDPILGGGIWVSREAIEDEGSGYALVVVPGVSAGWT